MVSEFEIPWFLNWAMVRSNFHIRKATVADSDSGIDIHTPLSRLMVQASLLSPHFKVLRVPTPGADPQPSYIANGLKVPNDRKNTKKRNTRYRDGKLLREGVGLTIHLGWSDSEDEDAPSPLTRRRPSMTVNSRITGNASLESSIDSFAHSFMISLNYSPSPLSIPTSAVFSSNSIASRHSSTTDPGPPPIVVDRRPSLSLTILHMLPRRRIASHSPSILPPPCQLSNASDCDALLQESLTPGSAVYDDALGFLNSRASVNRLK